MRKKGKRIAAAVLAAAGAACIWFAASRMEEPLREEDMTADLQTKEEDGAVSYINETVYDGSVVLDREVFQVPFRKSDRYCMNKEYIGTLEEKTAERLQKAAKDYLTVLVGSGYRSVMADEEGFCSRLEDCYAGDFLTRGMEEISVSEHAKEAAAWYTDNHVKLDADIVTDRSLVWKDGITYVRCDAALTVYSCGDAGWFRDMTGVDIEPGDSVKLLCDVGVVRGPEGYQVLSMDCVGTY